jgi:hypothetical protein
LLAGLVIGPFIEAAAAATPVCQSAASDPDGDGWGWENQASCIVAGGAADSAPTHATCQTNSDPDGDGWGWEDNRSCRMPSGAVADQKPAPATTGVHPPCTRDDSDPDGDGYGWENNASCMVQRTTNKPVTPSATEPARVTAPGLRRCTSPRQDPDRDGIGWVDNALCASDAGVAVCERADMDPDGDGIGWQRGKTCLVTSDRSVSQAVGGAGAQKALTLADITDVILVTGQSNVLGSMTAYDPGLDQPDQRVFAWTSAGWQTADLHQVWDRNGHPGNFSKENPNRRPYNNFAFHFGKALAQSGSGRVPAFIVASAPGKGISHWDRHGPFYREVSDKVQAALDALPHRDTIDGILWHQGETDWQFHGTSDPLASGIPASSPDYRNYYPIKLQALIKNFRSEPWASPGRTVFICGETRRAVGVNRHLMALNRDADPLSGCVQATDLPAREDDTDGSHFSAVGLRELGVRFARLYGQLNPR